VLIIQIVCPVEVLGGNAAKILRHTAIEENRNERAKNKDHSASSAAAES
jgi:hypothetical protein